MDLPCGVRECPRTYFPEAAVGYLTAWEEWRLLGLLPGGLALGDQPQGFAEAMLTCEDAERMVRRVQERALAAELDALKRGPPRG